MKTLLFSCRDQEQSFILQPLNDSNTTGGTRDGKSSLSIKVRRAPSLCCQSFTRAPAIITEKVHPGGHVPINLTTLQHFYQPWLFPTGRKKSHHEAHGRLKKKKAVRGNVRKQVEPFKVMTNVSKSPVSGPRRPDA